MFEGLKEKIRLNKDSKSWRDESIEDLKEAQREAYIDAFREEKIEQARQKAVADANAKGGFFATFRKFVKPYTPEEIKALAPKPIIVKETEGFYKKDN